MSNIVAKSDIPDPTKIELHLSVNGEVRQQDSTELMIFRIPRLLSDVSKVMTLEEGGVIVKGTPKGVGRVFPGDVVKAGIKVDGRELGVPK
jgi:acylpyruvate hydrolase